PPRGTARSAKGGNDERRPAAPKALGPHPPRGDSAQREGDALSASAAAQFTPRPTPLASERLAARGGLVLVAAALLAFLTLPLLSLLARSVEDRSGHFVGLANFGTYFASPAFSNSIQNTLVFALLTTAITVPLAFLFAYAIQRSRIPFKGLWRNIALIPILA